MSQASGTCWSSGVYVQRTLKTLDNLGIVELLSSEDTTIELEY